MKRLASFAALAALIVLCLKAPRSPIERHPLRDALASSSAQNFDGPNKDETSQISDIKASLQEFKNRALSQEQQPGVDLSDQFPPNKIPDQGQVGSCHDFAAIALLEAAFYRYYKIHMGFSEADLFAQAQMRSGEVCNDAMVYTAIDGSRQCGLGEGGYVDKDIKFILDRGVLTTDSGACASYPQFEKNYRERFQEPLVKALLKLDACNRSLPKVEPGKLKNTADRWEKPSPQAQAEREGVKEALSGFSLLKVHASSTHDPRWLSTVSSKECRESSAKQREVLIRQLDAGRPVAVYAELLGLKAWHPEQDPREHPESVAAHAFLVVGYKKGWNGKLTFQTRNSWVKDGQPYNPDLSSDELCHLFGIMTLLTPEEARSSSGG
jgi:hypothetical protein